MRVLLTSGVNVVEHEAGMTCVVKDEFAGTGVLVVLAPVVVVVVV